MNFKKLPATALGNFEMTAINQKILRYNESHKPVYIDEVIMGNVLQETRSKWCARQLPFMPVFRKKPTLLPVNKICAPG